MVARREVERRIVMAVCVSRALILVVQGFEFRDAVDRRQ
jgi:hypothetical protein